MRKPKDLKNNLFEVAEAQGGLFTALQAEKAGIRRSNHSYHVKQGNWIRVHRGIYRLSHFPFNPEQQMVTYSLWSQNLDGEIEGVYSHDTALSYYELSDHDPAKLHMTVPRHFRRSSEIPKILVLHVGDIPESDIQLSHGFSVTKPLRTLRDVIVADTISPEFILQAIEQALARGLVRKPEVEAMIQSLNIHEDTKREFLRTAMKAA